MKGIGPNLTLLELRFGLLEEGEAFGVASFDDLRERCVELLLLRLARFRRCELGALHDAAETSTFVVRRGLRSLRLVDLGLRLLPLIVHAGEPSVVGRLD